MLLENYVRQICTKNICTQSCLNIIVMLCYCCIVQLIVHLYSQHYIELVFMSRRNTTFWSKVGETGVGEMGVGEQGISHQCILGLLSHCRSFMSKFGIAHCDDSHASISKHCSSSSADLLLQSCKAKLSYESNSLTLRDYGYEIVFVAKHVMAGISA